MQFLKERFREFGPYEDAIVAQESILNHSVLSPLINSGLLTPDWIIDETIAHAEAKRHPVKFARRICAAAPSSRLEEEQLRFFTSEVHTPIPVETV